MTEQKMRSLLYSQKIYKFSTLLNSSDQALPYQKPFNWLLILSDSLTHEEF